MKKIILSLLLITPVFVSATGYDYLPDDVWIKQQEEKSELEFRLRQIEAGMSGNLESSLRTIEYRIDELERELQTEIGYIKGRYGQLGVANQIPSAVAKVSSEFEAEISYLEDERDELKKFIREEEEAQDAIEALEARIAELESQSVAESIPAYTPTQTIVRPTPEAMFEYIDSLSLSEASAVYNDLRLWDPEMYEDVKYLIDLTYPHGKPGSARYEEYQAAELADIANSIQSLQSEIQAATEPKIAPEPVYVPPTQPEPLPEPEVTEERKNPVATSTNETATTTETFNLESEEIFTEEPEPVTPVQAQPGFLSRVVNFFKSWF